MGKEKRKNRLDKGSSVAASGEFLGFGAFAQPLATDVSSDSPNQTSQASLRWSPVYTGSDSQLSILFKKIGQKRDGSTKAKALSELQDFFEDETKPRKEQVTALSHLLFVYHSKLNYDDFSSVRSASLIVIDAAKRRLPKAWRTLMDQQRELWGMVWCASADPSSEVQNAAQLLCGSISMEEWNGVWDFVTRMLSYGRAKMMHQELFARRSGEETLTDAERELLDERFERIVGSSLLGVTLWLQVFPETSSFLYNSSIKDSILWKPLTSSKSSFRLKAYELLGVMSCNAKSTVYGAVGSNYLPKLLPAIVSQEREAANIPRLFEVLLLYINNGDTDTLSISHLVKSLNKMLRNACYASSPLLWGPAMLPLLVSIKEDELIVSVLSALLAGRDAAIGLSDTLLISSSAAECAAYFMIRDDGQGQVKHSCAVSIAHVWLDTLKTYLSTTGVSSVSRKADESLEGMLGKTLCRFDESSLDSELCVIYRERDWFWIEQLPGVMLGNTGPEGNLRFNKLIQNMMNNKKRSHEQSRLFPILREKFHAVLSTYQAHSGCVPSDQDYRVMQTALEFSSCSNIFGSSPGGDETGIESFIMNDLLRWMVIHASELRTAGGHVQGNVRAVRDFSLLRVCLETVQSAHKQKLFWEAVLRELIAAKCDLGVLAMGLQELCWTSATAQTFSIAEVVKCKHLDDLGVRVVEEALEISPIGDSTKTEEFLRTCTGLHQNIASPLVARGVVSKWIELLWSQQSNPFLAPILQILLELGITKAFLSSSDNSKVVLLAWQVGGGAWISCGRMLAKQEYDNVRKDFHEVASQKLRASLLDLSDSSQDASLKDASLKKRYEQCDDWSRRALRWFHSNENLTDCNKFDFSGLGNIEMWRVASRSDGPTAGILFRCLSTFLKGLADDADRANLLLVENRTPLFACVLAAASTLEGQLRTWKWEDTNCYSLISLVGGRAKLGDYLVLSIMGHLVETLEEAVEAGAQCATRRGIFAISTFLAATLQPFLTEEKASREPVDAADIKAGDKVWYFASSQEEHDGAQVEIVKIHSDDFPRLYFTIKIENEGSVQEKQTVAERLRKVAPSRHVITGKDMLPEQIDLREKLSNLLVDKVVRGGMGLQKSQDFNRVEAAAQCMHIVLSHCGVFGKAGIGSLRYELFQLLSNLQLELIQSLEARNFEIAGSQMRGLSLAMGFGDLSYQSQRSLQYYNFDPEPSLLSLVGAYKGEESVKQIDHPTLMWMSTAFDSVPTVELKAELMQVIPMIVSRAPVQDHCDGLLAMHAMGNVLRLSSNERSTEWETKAVSNIINAFAKKFDVQETVEGDSEVTAAEGNDLWWSRPLDLLVNDIVRHNVNLLRAACRENAPHLINIVSQKSKRSFALCFLQFAARFGAPLHVDASEEMLPKGTQRRLNHWRKGMITEDAEDLEDDILTVFEWIPATLMTEIEAWIDDHDFFDEPSEEIVIARMLSWLAFLQYLEAAAVKDPRYRMSFSAYAKKSGGVFFILSTCVMFLNVELDRKSSISTVTTIDDILRKKESIDVEDLSSAVLFHTVEVFPTLSREWWEDDCPKSLAAMISKFVQVVVAPETLCRELQRIEAARNLGGMTVRGSSVSREVTATYLQDECTLSIAIQIPPNFPLRSVDVDGRRTLGIPENRFKRWALQIRQILSNQDGTLLDALMLWKRNVEKEFEGVEPCPVCYSVLSVKTHELPNLECKTCSNTFHSSCLYKWFASSGKSQCVLCQQPWSGTRIN